MSILSKQSMSLATPDAQDLSSVQKIAISQSVVGVAILLLATFNVDFPNKSLFLFLALGLISLGVIVFARDSYLHTMPGIKNDGVWFRSASSRGMLGWATGVFLTTFYIVLYFFPGYLGLGVNAPNTGLVAFFDPLSQLLSGRPASQWFVYGTLYTVLILVFGYKFILKYRHNRYEQIRTVSVMFFQLGFAFLIPEFMYRMNSTLPYYDLKSVWPLNYYFFDQWSIDAFLSNGSIGLAFILFAVFSTFVITPILTYKFGKRWYCSWVCGCGGLAETAGDSYRHLSSKKMVAWKIERWLIHTVLVFSVVMTTGVIYSYLGTDSAQSWFTKKVFISFVIAVLSIVFTATMIFKRNEFGKDAKFGAIGFGVTIVALLALFFTGSSTEVFFIDETTLRSAYGFYIGSIFSGVIGTGLYPLLGNRSWCRFGCPMAAILGFQQRLFSKFRITTNGGQCISCGNCSTFCEMGIDVRAYAQKGENIVRSSCVGCGICAAVCPRGVLKLENGSMNGRINPTQIPLGNDLALMDLMNLLKSK